MPALIQTALQAIPRDSFFINHDPVLYVEFGPPPSVHSYLEALTPVFGDRVFKNI